VTNHDRSPDSDIFSLLKELSETPGVSGQEERIRSAVSNLLAPLVDELRVDTLGNLIGFKQGAIPSIGRVMLAAHMDEVGLIVTRLDGGFLRFAPVGGVDMGALPAQEVTVHGRSDLPGLIASRPPHVLSAEEREKPFTQEQLFVDVGLSADMLAESVAVGDFVSIRRSAERLGKGHATGKALDNRVSLVVLIEALRILGSRSHAWDIYAVVTVQEEIGLRGATTAAFQVAPDVGIALDVTYAEQPGAPAEESLPMGGGPAIGLGPNLHPKLRALLVDAAERSEIPFTNEVLPGHSGTDAWAMQVSQSGIPTALISVPVRNMHTAAESVALKDIERSARLLAETICALPDDLSALALDDEDSCHG
jgi:endoglucanase